MIPLATITKIAGLFGPWLLMASLRASLLALITVCLQLAMGRWLPAQWRYALWLPMVLVLVAPVLPPNPFRVEKPLSVQLAVVAMDSGLPPALKELPAGIGGMPLAAAAAWHTGRGEWFFMVWLLGTLVVLTTGAVGFGQTLRGIRRNAVEPDPRVIGEVAAAVRNTGLSRGPRVLVSTAVQSPAVTGLFRPTLLLPAGFPEGFTPGEARLILLHELTHLRRLDVPLNWLLCVLQAMHWFNPVLWLAFGRMRADREAACDAQVLCVEGEDCRADYGCVLLKLGSGGMTAILNPAFVGIFEFASMKLRLQAIARHRRPHCAWAFASVVLMVGMILLTGARARSADAPPEIGDGNSPTHVEIDCRIAEVEPDPSKTFEAGDGGTSNYWENPRHMTTGLTAKQTAFLLGELGANTSAFSRTVTFGQTATAGVTGEDFTDNRGSVRVTITPTLVHDKIVLALKVSTDGVIEPQSKLMVMQIREGITDGENLLCVGLPKTEPGGRDLFVLATAHLVK